MNPEIHTKRKEVHRRIVRRLAEMVATATSFVLIFSVLMTVSNWSAYSKILQDLIDPSGLENYLQANSMSDSIEDEFQARYNLLQSDPDSFLNSEGEFQVSSEQLGTLYPGEMRLEVPKVFSGTIPIKNVDLESFDFSKMYESENAIQDALREGVVHYPFTADPDQYGNVFITGHSSYTPWDSGRYKDIFALLHRLEIGDQYFIYFEGKKYTYKVQEKFEILPTELSVLEQPVDQHLSTLMTCTPVGTTLRRLIIRAPLTSVE